MSLINMSILIKNGTVINWNSTEYVDVLIENEKISRLGNKIAAPPGARVVDASNCYVLPGGIDPHTHLELEFMGAQTADDFYHGTKAAVAGGTTCVIDFVIPNKGESLLEAYSTWRNRADGKVVCDYGLHMAVTWWSDQVVREMEYLTQHSGINSFKMFMAYKNSFMIDDGELFNSFETCERLGALPMVHAENGHVIYENTQRLLASGVTGPMGHQLSRPESLEEEATNRACVVAEQAKSALYVVHVMSAEAARVIAQRRERFKRIFGETLAAGLGKTFPETSDFTEAAAHVMSPPLRSNKDNPGALMGYLASGALSTTATDNCTFNKCQKQRGEKDFTKIPNGVNGVEDRMSIVWDRGVVTKKLSLNDFVKVTSTNAAKIFNIFPRKGLIAPGSDADIVIWNPNKSRTISASTHHHNCDYNIFEGQTVKGVPEVVMVRGHVVFEKEQLNVTPGWGKFIARNCFSPEVFPEKWTV